MPVSLRDDLQDQLKETLRFVLDFHGLNDDHRDYISAKKAAEVIGIKPSKMKRIMKQRNLGEEISVIELIRIFSESKVDIKAG